MGDVFLLLVEEGLHGLGMAGRGLLVGLFGESGALELALMGDSGVREVYGLEGEVFILLRVVLSERVQCYQGLSYVHFLLVFAGLDLVYYVFYLFINGYFESEFRVVLGFIYF